jgi:hypothetical protein
LTHRTRSARLGLEPLEARDVPAGDGLTAVYYDNADFTGPSLTRIDPGVNFDWGVGSPAGELKADTFSARWTGQVEAPASGTFTFYTVSDDGVRLWVNGQLLVDNWTRHRATENSGTITLAAGQRYDIRMDYFEQTGRAVARLLWSGPGVAKQVIPVAALYSVRPPAAPSGLTATATSPSSVRLTWADNSADETGFVVERSPNGTTFAAVGTVGANVTVFDDTGLAAGTTYTYRVRATNAAGPGAPSATAAVSTPPERTVVTVSTTAQFRSAVNAATPNTTILLQPGVYAGGNYFSNINGQPGREIIIGAADPNNKPIIRGGGEGIHLTDVSYLELRDLVIEGATSNGINIDDGGSYATPSHHVTLRNLVVRDIGSTGNQDGIKLSGVRDFLVTGADVRRWGAAGSGIDMVGCHHGVIADSFFGHNPGSGSHGVQAKGGSTGIAVRDNRFEHAGLRAVQIGGSTGLEFFRPQPPAGFEAKDVTVEGNVIIGSQAAVTFVNVDGALVRYNTIYRPTRWVFRILQETTAPGFVPSRHGVVTDNIVAWRTGDLSTFVNVGSGTAPGTFTFARNWWFRIDNPGASQPSLPTPESNGVYGIDPQFVAPESGDLRLRPGSPATNYGAYAPRP